MPFSKHGVIFAPSVVPAYRGMVVEVPLHLGAMPGGPSVDSLRSALEQFYGGSSVVTVARSTPGEILFEAQREAMAAQREREEAAKVAAL